MAFQDVELKTFLDTKVVRVACNTYSLKTRPPFTLWEKIRKSSASIKAWELLIMGKLKKKNSSFKLQPVGRDRGLQAGAWAILTKSVGLFRIIGISFGNHLL